MRLEAANRLRHRVGSPDGHYESYFIRANHATSALAFWIRYTMFSPAGHPEQAQGELWAIVFDGLRNHHVAVKQAWPLACVPLRPRHAGDRSARCALEPAATRRVRATRRTIASCGTFVFAGGQSTLLLLPERLYDGGFPKAKSLVSRPLARFDGTISVDGERIDVHGWAGSQNHNWGRQHTDRYAWGQVAGFDGGHDESFLEVASAKLKVGPLWTPWITPIVLRHRGHEHRLNATGPLAARAGIGGRFRLALRVAWRRHPVRGRIHAERADFVGLRYANPPGGSKQCLNSKIAHAQMTLQHADGSSETLSSQRRAAFELLGDDSGHGVPMAC